MKIGVFLPQLRPETGGAFTFVETAVSGLLGASTDDSVVVFHYGEPGDIAQRFVGRPVRFHSLATSAASRFVKKAWFSGVSARLQAPLNTVARALGKELPYPSASPLDREARRAGIDLMWFPTPMFEMVDVPYVVTVWDLEHRAHPYFPELAAHGEWSARESYFSDGLRRATYVITGTLVGRDEIVRYYNVEPTRIRLLPHPTPAFALAAAHSRPLPFTLAVQRPFVFYPAQFWAHKNHVGLVDAVAELAQRGTLLDIAFVGSDKGNLQHVRSHAASIGIADRVHFLGFVSREQLISLYQHAAALVYTSLCGPENLPPLEAMALGCPVIAADIAGAREQLGDAALLVDPLDPIATADAISRVLAVSPLRDELIEKGRIRAARYTQHEFGRDLSAVVDDFRRRRALWQTAR